MISNMETFGFCYILPMKFHHIFMDKTILPLNQGLRSQFKLREATCKGQMSTDLLAFGYQTIGKQLFKTFVHTFYSEIKKNIFLLNSIFL